MTAYTHNSDGIEYAKITDLQAGDKVNVDSAFTCRTADWATIREAPGKKPLSQRLYIPCRFGRHYLYVSDGIHCIGITRRI